MNVVGIIPARFKSTRFPGKPLADILGKSMIHRVYDQCKKCSLLNDIIVATDDKRIFNHVEEFGGQVMMSADSHKTGTERCGEIVRALTSDYDIIVNIQGDEPYINPEQITQLLSLFNEKKTEIATLAKKISENKSIDDRNHVKILFNKDDIATNFFRSIPANYSTAPFYRHIGIYAYTKNTLLKICQLNPTKHELTEKLEQLRWMENGYQIKVGITELETISVDTPDDILKIKANIR